MAGVAALEIGGPSRIFSSSGLIPIYEICRSVDNSTFATRTIWQGELQEGGSFRWRRGRVLGKQFICDAVDLRGIASETYDLVCSAYVIQHIANPLRALSEWRRVLKPGGVMVIVIPHKERTFDHRRPVTQLSHLMDDFSRGTTEDDMTHIDEVLRCHDLSLDPLAGSFEQFRERTLKNSVHRAVHQHVFDTDLVLRMLDHAQFQICHVQLLLPDNIIVICRKASGSEAVANASLIEDSRLIRFGSPGASHSGE